MEIGVKSLIYAILAFLSFHELSAAKSLEQLFPHSRGILFPPVVIEPLSAFPRCRNVLQSFDAFNQPTPLDPSSRIARRGKFIIGVMQGDFIKEITENGLRNHIFDTQSGKWEQLPSPTPLKLGIGQRLLFVESIDRTIFNRVMHNPYSHAEEHEGIALTSEKNANYVAINELYIEEIAKRRRNIPVDPEQVRKQYHSAYDRQYHIEYENGERLAELRRRAGH